MAFEEKSDADLLTEYIELGRAEGHSFAMGAMVPGTIGMPHGSWNNRDAARMQAVHAELLRRMSSRIY